MTTTESTESTEPSSPKYYNQAAIDALCDRALTMQITLDGKPAMLGGRSLPFPKVGTLDGSQTIEFSWQTVETVLNAGGNFFSSTKAERQAQAKLKPYAQSKLHQRRSGRREVIPMMGEPVKPDWLSAEVWTFVTPKQALELQKPWTRQYQNIKFVAHPKDSNALYLEATVSGHTYAIILPAAGVTFQARVK